MQSTEVRTPRGRAVTILTRDDTSDLSLVGSTFNLWGNQQDEYRLGELRLGPGDVFVDVGAHIGIVSFAALLDNPGCRAIAVEPLSENIEVLRLNADALGLSDRITVLHGAVGTGKTMTVGFDYSGTEYARTNRFIGALQSDAPAAQRSETVKVYTLSELVKLAGGRIAALKTDCEGGEWGLFKSRAIASVGIVIGEWHTRVSGEAIPLLHRIFDATHRLEILSDMGGTGLFRATPTT